MQTFNTVSPISGRIPAYLVVAGSAWISRIVTAGVQFLSIRILLEGLGTEQYAVFALLYSLMNWYMLTDAGLGSSLQNHISECRAVGRHYDDYLSLAATMAAVLLVLTIVFTYLITPFVAPVLLRHFDFLSDAEKNSNFFVIGALFIASAIGNIAYRVWYAEQKGHLSNIIPAIASLISFLGILLVVRSGLSQKLFWSLVVFLAPTALFAMISFLWQMSRLFKLGLNFNPEIFSKLMKRAGKFWVFGIMAAGVLQIDYIVLSQFVAPREIVKYNITTKVYLFATFIYGAVLMALMPVCAEMIARNNWQGVVGYIKRYLSLAAGFIVLFILLTIWFMPNIVKILSPGDTEIAIPLPFIILIGIYQLIRAWTDIFTMVLQSMSHMRPFLLWVPVQAAINAFLQWKLTPLYGIYGVAFGLIASYVFTVSWVLPLTVRRNIKRSREYLV